MTMSLLSIGILFTSALLATLFNLLPAACLDKWPLSAPQAMLMEDKSRLGSTPPSCHNRCGACDPCTAVQVPTLPSRGVRAAVPLGEQTFYSKYSNYKPLGWKCRCGDRLFNP